jgi:hypothetical protein
VIDRSSLVHGGLAVAAIALAAWAWTSPQGKAGDAELTVLAGKADELDAVSWTDGDGQVVVGRDGSQVKVSVARKAAASSAPAGATPPPMRIFPGTDAARELFGKLAPLRATRDLGAVAEAELPHFGFGASAARLELRFGKSTEVVEVGATSFGGNGVYLRAGGRVYLARTGVVADLRGGASSLTDRSLVSVPRTDVERVTLSAGARTRELVQRSADDRAKAFFADPAEPDTRLGQTTAWLDRLMRTRLTDFTTERPAGPPALSLHLFGERGPLGSLELWAPGDAVAIAVSSAFPTPLTVSRATAETLLKDLDAVLAEGPAPAAP